jgi:hypothetical protein
LRYARSHYQNNSGYNQFGLNIRLSDYFGKGIQRPGASQ